MEHYIREIHIDKLRHLSDIDIVLNPNRRQHLMITGKNGSGKTSLLIALQKYLQAICGINYDDLIGRYISKSTEIQKNLDETSPDTEKLKIENDNEYITDMVKMYADDIRVAFSDCKELGTLFRQGDFITAYFPANRKTEIIRSRGVEDIKLADFYEIWSMPGKLLHKYMVHLKTQQAYARNEGDMSVVNRIQEWFDRFVNALRVLLDDEAITLEYDYKEYDFIIHEPGREPFGFDTLSDGYSSVIHVVSDLIMRMDKNWLLKDEISKYDVEGIVLIDELETHLHIDLQKKILPFLTGFFPGIQFIISTHSPYILNSISNAKVYDLENCMELEDLSLYSSDALAEGYFGADEYSDKLKEKINRYEELKEKKELTEKEQAERAKLRSELKNIPKGLSWEAADKFQDIEGNCL